MLLACSSLVTLVLVDSCLKACTSETYCPSLHPKLRFENCCKFPAFCDYNALGFRDREVGVPKPRDVFRVAVLGDSVAAGEHLSIDHTLARQLERRLRELVVLPGRRIEVMNNAVRGYDVIQSEANLHHKVLPLEPDAVVYVFFTNDFVPTIGRGGVLFPDVLWDPKRDWHEDSLHGFLLRRSAIYLNVWTRRMLRDPVFVRGLDALRSRPAEMEYEALLRMADLCRAARIPLLVAVVPMHVLRDDGLPACRERSRGIGLDPDNCDNEQDLVEAVLAFCRQHDIDCRDMRPAYGRMGGADVGRKPDAIARRVHALAKLLPRKARDHLVEDRPDPIHPDETGTRALAEDIAACLTPRLVGATAR
ncbi:MAG: SGNH/GDSL hydrolase family protein [Deltaproteobacteria bacterium]|nr:SGNH/GDSL hydrolase family protein [Deltaproteobacteria bacterium]